MNLACFPSNANIVKEQNKMTQLQALVDSTKEYTLSNGLKVLIKEDHSAPVFTQAVFYKVGSRNDPKGQTGISHYLEHMQFNGTNTRPKGSISGEIEKRGGTFNAATSTDFTMYYMTLPSEAANLSFSLELEADRMRNSILNKTEADRERQVVLAELMGGENNPMTLLHRDILQTTYPNHPYGAPIIGWQEDVKAISAENLREHYDTYYQPNNAVLIVVGDIDTATVLAQAENTLGKIAKSEKTIKSINAAGSENPTKHEVVVKSPSETSILSFVWNAVSFKDSDYVPLSVLSAILTNGSLSRLEKSLVDTGKVSYVSSSMRQGIDPFTFSIITATTKDADLEDIRRNIQQEIQKIQTQGVSKEELERVKAKTETSFLFGLEDSAGLVTQLGFFELVSGDWRRAFYWPKEIAEVTPEKVQAVAKKYLTNEKLVIGKLVNDPNAKGPAGPAYANVPAVANYKAADQSVTLSSKTKGIQSEELTLPNGLRVILRQNPTYPILAASGTVDAGEVFDTNQIGVSALTGMMIDRGSEKYDRDSLNNALENIGADIDISPEKDFLLFSAKSRAQDYDKIVELLAQEIRFPIFPKEELDKLKLQLLSELQQSKDDLSALGKIAIYDAIFSDKHPYSEASIPEQMQSVNKLTESDLKAFHKAYYQPKRVILTFSGSYDREELLKTINKYFGDWKNQEKAANFEVPLAPLSKANKEETIEVPGKSQALIIMGHAGELTRGSEDFYALLVANDILGGGSTLSSRLGTRVREEAGLVYTIRSSVAMGRGAGPFLVQMGVEPGKIQEAIKLTKEELVKFCKGEITDEELERAKSYRRGFFISNNLTSNESIASSLNQYALWGLSLNTINEYPDKIKALTKQDIVRVSQKYLFPEKLQMVILKPKQ